VRKSLLVAAEERWLVPTYASRRSGVWIAAHACLMLPFRVCGSIRRYHAPEVVGRSLTVLTVGAPRRLRAFCGHLLDPLYDTSPGPVQGLWSPRSLESAGAGADVVVVQIHRWAAARFRREGWYIVPDAVRWRGELAHMPPEPPSKSLRDDLRKVRLYRYELEPATTAADWDEFYATMVVPHAERRFGEAAWIPSAGLRRTLRKVGTLQFVRRGDVRVGGLCVVPSGHCAWVPLLSVLAGNEALRREGALAAAYALGLEWARASGYRSMDLGRTSAFLNDGIAVYKRKWGFTPVPDPLSHLFAVRVGPAVSATDLFARQPVLIETDTGLASPTGAAE
jgi:hypothetical protein